MQVLMPVARWATSSNFKTGTIIKTGYNLSDSKIYKEVIIGAGNKKARYSSTKTFYEHNKPTNIHKTEKMSENCDGVTFIQKKSDFKHKIVKFVKSLFGKFNGKDDWAYVDSKVRYAFDKPSRVKNYNTVRI